MPPEVVSGLPNITPIFWRNWLVNTRQVLHQRLSDLQRLLAGVRLADIEVGDINANLGRVSGIQRVLDIHKAADAAVALRFGNGMKTDGGFAGAFRPVNLDNAPARQPADAERNVQAQAAGGDRFDLQTRSIAQLHDDALSIFLVQVGKGGVKRLALSTFHNALLL
jgi:hypothetical protein